MAKEFAKDFYNSRRWRRNSKTYAESRFCLCELCGRPYDLVHHKIFLTTENIIDEQVTMNWDNLQAVCLDCHNKIHNFDRPQLDSVASFDADGNLIDICTPPHGVQIGGKSVHQARLSQSIKM